ncbi:MAG TPA: hypothetical protein VGQ83_05970 [Polyangia bacterium]|jgi:hypothetical protein
MCHSFMDLAAAARRVADAPQSRGVALVAAVAAALGPQAAQARVQDLTVAGGVALDLLGLQIVEDVATEDRWQGGLHLGWPQGAALVRCTPFVLRLPGDERLTWGSAVVPPAQAGVRVAAAWRALPGRLRALAHLRGGPRAAAEVAAWLAAAGAPAGDVAQALALWRGGPATAYHDAVVAVTRLAAGRRSAPRRTQLERLAGRLVLAGPPPGADLAA